MTQLFLTVVSPEGVSVHTVESDPLVVGRSPDCDIVVADPWVSRHHLEVSVDDGSLRIRDLDSRNPPKVDGEVRREALLSAGNAFQLGGTSITVSRTAEDAQSSTVLQFGKDPSPSAVHTEIALDESETVSQAEEGVTDDASRVRRIGRLGERIAAVKSRRELLDTTLEGLFGLMPVTRGFIGLGDPREGQFAEIATRDPLTEDSSAIEMSRAILETIYANRSALLVRDTASLDGGVTDSIQDLGIRSFAAAPILIGDRFEGVIYLDSTRQGRAIEESDLEGLKVVARLCALSLENLESRDQLSRENEQLRGILQRRQGIIASSKPMSTALARIHKAGTFDSPVLIRGETGTGKELAARAIHDQSPRSEAAFVAFNCALASESMIDSELFGHVRGAFTDAVRDHRGVFEQAHGGTLFLDEIGDMPAPTQVKILRAVQEGIVVPVGGEAPVEVDVRLVSATHCDLVALQKEGRFREDLYYRLAVLQIELPPLRERGEDITEIADSFLPPAVSLTEGAANALLNYRWPGNVRELRNVIEQALFNTEGSSIRLQDLPPEVAKGGRRSRIETRLESLSEAERRHIEHVLEATEGNKKRAAEILGIARDTLYQKLRAYRDASGGRS